MKVTIRADASTELGTGHVMRCLTLSKRLHQKGAEVSFLSREMPGDLCALTEREGFKIQRLSDQDAGLPGKDLLQRYHQKPDWLIIDHYELDSKWEKTARTRSGRIFVIDDLANRPHDCDVLLDQNFYPEMKTRYQGRVPEACRLILGPRFALLREEFLARASLRPRSGAVERILVFLGGADQSNDTAKAVLALKELPRSVSIDVIVGPSNPNKKELALLCRSIPRTRFYDTVPNMADLLDTADLAIGGGGTASWERCYMGVPAVTLVLAENQRETTEALQGQGAAINLGWHENVTPRDITKAVRQLMEEPAAVQAMSRAARDVMGGSRFKGAEASVDVIMEKRYATAQRLPT